MINAKHIGIQIFFSEKKQEMTMKEKFYLFLEKGFCPELEQGVQDPIYKRHGGKMKLHNKPGKLEIANTYTNLYLYHLQRPYKVSSCSQLIKTCDGVSYKI